jgi:hypothetical protein
MRLMTVHRRNLIFLVSLLVCMLISITSCATTTTRHYGKKSVYLYDDTQPLLRFIYVMELYQDSKTFKYEYDYYSRPSVEMIMKISGKYELKDNTLSLSPEYIYTYSYVPFSKNNYKKEYIGLNEIPEENKRILYRVEKFTDKNLSLVLDNTVKTSIPLFDEAVNGITSNILYKRSIF